MKDLVTEIWEIRGMVDLAIENKDTDLFYEAYERYMKISETKSYLKSYVLDTIGKEATSHDEKIADRQANWDRLTFNLGTLLARVQTGKYTFIPYGKAKSLLDIIWLSRAMFDDCGFASENLSEEERILIRLTAVQDELAYCYHNVPCYADEQVAIMNIRKEIKETREKLYGNKGASLFDAESQMY